MKRLVFLLILFACVEVSLALYLTAWREAFWQAVSLKQGEEFLKQLGVFTGVALGICIVSGVTGYVLSLTAIKWREILDARVRALGEQDVENFSQRHQEDCMQFPDLVLSLTFGAFKATLYIVVFSVSLTTHFAFWYLGVLVLYTMVGSWVTSKVAKPLIQLNYAQQRIEATYRQQLTLSNFKSCVFIMLGIAKKQKQLTYTQTLYSQVGVVLPLVLIAPLYFTTGMTIGALMRFNSLASTVLENMSYGVTSFGTINKLLSCKKRLKEIGVL